MYHTAIMSVARVRLIILLLTLVAGCIRLFQLGVIPHGFTWDEAAIGYNGYAVITTRRDEWLERLPVSFQSFGDYKAPLAIYLNGFFTVLFGLEPWVVRLPFALFGVASIPVLFLVFTKIFQDFKQKNRALLVSLAAGMLVFSPWHILYSRTGFESGIALVFFLVFVGLFFHALSTSLGIAKRTLFFATSGVAGCFAMYSYHSAKLAVPLFGLVLVAVTFNRFRLFWKESIIALVAVVATLLPMLRDAFYGSGLDRAGVSVFTQTDFWSAIKLTLAQIVQHLSPGFLVFGETTTLRHGTGEWGVLLPTTFFLALAAAVLWILAKKKMLKTFFLLWVLVGILPAAISTESPHSNRSLLALPGFIGLAVLGIQDVLDFLKRARSWPKTFSREYARSSFLGTLVCLHTLLAVAFLQHYFVVYAPHTAAAFYDGYLDAFAAALEYEKGSNGKPKVERIYVSTEYGQPYIYALFVRKTNPIWYQGGSLSERYSFLETVTNGDLERSNALLIAGGASTIDPSKATETIYGSDGSVRFRLYYLPPRE